MKLNFIFLSIDARSLHIERGDYIGLSCIRKPLGGQVCSCPLISNIGPITTPGVPAKYLNIFVSVYLVCGKCRWQEQIGLVKSSSEKTTLPHCLLW